MEKFLKKIMTKEVMFYIILGICTTLVNLISFQLLTKVCKLNDNLSNAIAIILSVLFAYITNKDIVFHSEASSAKEKWMEFFKFILGRAATMVLEFVGGLLMFKLPIDKMISKISNNVYVVEIKISRFNFLNNIGFTCINNTFTIIQNII